MPRTTYRFPKDAWEIHAVKATDEPGWYSCLENSRWRRRWRPYTLGHLRGERPEGHPETIVWHGNGRHPRVEAHQVWVSAEGLLVTITNVAESGEVTYVYYKCPCCVPKTVSYDRFRNDYKIWEKKIKACRSALENLVELVAQGAFNSLEEATTLYGLDPKTGVRIA